MLEAIDRRILAILQQEGNLSAADVAERVGLTQSPCWRRISRLREQGYIRGYSALLDRSRLGLDMVVFAQVRLTSQGRRQLKEVAAAVSRLPEVQDCYVLMGEIDFMLKIVVADVAAYERFFFERLSQIPGVDEVRSSMAMSEVKSTPAFAL